MNLNAFHRFSYGVYIVSTMDKERGTGCVCNSVMQITNEPATIAVSMNRENYTHACIEKMQMFAVAVLSEEVDGQLITTFGFQSGKTVDKFAKVAYQTIEGMPVVMDACAYAICKVVDQMEASTHTVFLGEVIALDVLKDAKPMTYAYYHQVKKGTSPKRAPTYIPAVSEWKCRFCQYVYDGVLPFEQVGDDYVCPVCGKPKSWFEKL